MRRRTSRVILVVVLLVPASVGLGVAQEDQQFVRGEPGLGVYVPDPTLTPGSTTELTVQVANDGEVRSGAVAQREMVTTARGVTVEVDDGDVPFTVETELQSIGSIADGDVRDVPIAITVPEDVAPGEYSLDVTLRYSHTSLFSQRSGVVEDQSRTVTETVDLTIDDGPRFEIRSIDSDVQVGDSGTLVAEISNVGGEPARDLTVGLESNSPDVTLGEGTENAAWLDGLDPGEDATIDYEVNVRPGASHRDLALTGTVQFTDSNGVRDAQEGLAVGVRPGPEQAFSLSVDESTLRVGETGTIRGTIANDGPADVNDVVLVVGAAQFEPRSSTYAVGDLAAGESSPFQFRGTVPSGADAAPQQIDVTARYRTSADAVRSTNSSVLVPVEDRRDAITVSAIEPRFDPGESGVLALEVTNQRDVEVRDVQLRLAVEEPLESEFRTAVVPSLQPGESDRIAFDLEVDGDAPASRYPAIVAVNHTDPDDDRVTTRPATIAVTVTEASGEGLSAEIFVFVALLLLVGAGGWWFYRR